MREESPNLPDMPADAARGALEVFSCGTGPLPGDMAAELACFDHVFGSPRLLALLPDRAGCVRHFLKPTPSSALGLAMDCAANGQRAALLASGDALYHGLGGTLARLLQERFPDRTGDKLPFAVRFRPGVTAFQALFHRLGLAWDKARLFSVHSTKASLRPMMEAELAVIYTGLPMTGELLVKALLDVFPESAGRQCVLARDLGTDHEAVFRGTLADAAMETAGPTSILILLPEGAPRLVLPLGLDDGTWRFERHCLTARQIRPLALSCLRLPVRGVLWDLGAGSGSVGLEAALLRPDLKVEAVEKVPGRCRNIKANRARLGIANFTLHEGGMEETLDALPAPNRVFLGGGGSALPAILPRVLARLDAADPDAVCVVTAIALETVAFLSQYGAGRLLEVLSVDAAVGTPMPGGRYTRMTPLNRIHIFVFHPGKTSRSGGM